MVAASCLLPVAWGQQQRQQQHHCEQCKAVEQQRLQCALLQQPTSTLQAATQAATFSHRNVLLGAACVEYSNCGSSSSSCYRAAALLLTLHHPCRVGSCTSPMCCLVVIESAQLAGGSPAIGNPGHGCCIAQHTRTNNKTHHSTAHSRILYVKGPQ